MKLSSVAMGDTSFLTDPVSELSLGGVKGEDSEELRENVDEDRELERLAMVTLKYQELVIGDVSGYDGEDDSTVNIYDARWNYISNFRQKAHRSELSLCTILFTPRLYSGLSKISAP